MQAIAQHSRRGLSTVQSRPRAVGVHQLSAWHARPACQRPVHVRVADDADKPQAPVDQQSAQQQGQEVPQPSKLTTWEYGKTRDPGLVGYFMASLFLLPVLLVIAPLLANLGK